MTDNDLITAAVLATLLALVWFYGLPADGVWLG